MSRLNHRLLLGGVLLLAAVVAAYSNHFENSFHFDDLHSITENPAIRNLRNVPRFFSDVQLSSVLPANRTYRPVTSASLALDYWIGGGDKAFYFHLSTFVWFTVLLGLVFLMFLKAMDVTDPHPSNGWTALLGTACYGLHPVSAETVNYIVQRADLYSTLGVVAGVVVWAWRPAWRNKGIYLVPPLAGVLAKAPAAIFPLVLVAWVILVEEDARKWRTQIAIAFVVFAGALLVLRAKTPPTFNPGASSSYRYWITQPFVALHYFRSFFLPTGLTADTDLSPLTGALSDGAVIGFAFVCGLAYAAVRAARRPVTRPIAFGIAWFFLALAPTSLLPLAEVENDHRMFFPFVGLTLAVVWSLRLLVFARTQVLWRRAAVAGAVLVLGGFAWATYRRNGVWRTEETLWRDVAVKSPHNGRGLMNYGLTLMARGDYAGALALFERAQLYVPAYPLLEVNLGIVTGQLNRDEDAERHFRRALELAPGDAISYYMYGRWLRSRGRVEESMAALVSAIARNPSLLDPRYLLMAEYSERREWDNLHALAAQTLELAPGDVAAAGYLHASPGAEPPPTAESYIDLSMAQYRAGRYSESIVSAKEALRLNPKSAEAYNNIAAGYNSLGMWDEGIRAAQEAIRLNPAFQLAKNNLAWAESEKKRTAKH